jgi:high-affinity K+ transport system ATPase subunit B
MRDKHITLVLLLLFLVLVFTTGASSVNLHRFVITLLIVLIFLYDTLFFKLKASALAETRRQKEKGGRLGKEKEAEKKEKKEKKDEEPEIEDSK